LALIALQFPRILFLRRDGTIGKGAMPHIIRHCIAFDNTCNGGNGFDENNNLRDRCFTNALHSGTPPAIIGSLVRSPAAKLMSSRIAYP
jgi:hypothetical protein